MSASPLVERISSRSDVEHVTLRSGCMYELDCLKEDRELEAAARACCELQKSAALERLRNFIPSPDAVRSVSPEALDEVLRSGRVPSDVITDPDITNFLMFHRDHDSAILRDDIVELRRRLDVMVERRLRELFPRRTTLAPVISGQFLYPPGSHLAWHTNARVPGWRLYLVYAEEPGRSFFRYRDTRAGEIVTAWDDTWNARMLNFDSRELFWHAVYSETYRFSFGYRLDAPPQPAILHRLAVAARRVRSGLRDGRRPR